MNGVPPPRGAVMGPERRATWREAPLWAAAGTVAIMALAGTCAALWALAELRDALR